MLFACPDQIRKQIARAESATLELVAISFGQFCRRMVSLMRQVERTRLVEISQSKLKKRKHAIYRGFCAAILNALCGTRFVKRSARGLKRQALLGGFTALNPPPREI